MGFVSGVNIVTAADVAAILHEVGLTNLDTDPATGSADANATILNACINATNFIIRELKKRGANPARVTNTTDFKEVAARWVRATVFEADAEDERKSAKAASDRTWIAREMKEIVIEEDTAGGDQATQGPRGPVVVNFDFESNFARGVDNRMPGTFPGLLYQNEP